MPSCARTWGDPAAPTVVMLPGAGGTRWLWTPHADVLAEEYRVVSMDMPAHGTHPRSSFDFDRAVRDVGDVLDVEGPAVLVGHSLGGRVAMEAAAAHRERVDGLLAAGVGTHSGPAGRFLQTALSYAVEIGTKSTRIRAWMDEQYGLDDDRQTPPETADTHDAAVATARGIRGAVSSDPLGALEQYQGPTVLAYGEAERDTESAERLADRVGAALQWYEGGHGVPSRDPRTFCAVVSEFLAEVSGDETSVADAQ